MDLHECLRGELARVAAVADAVAPEIAAPRSWIRRVMAAFAGLVL